MESVLKKVSVVMCTYNGESFLREQLETVVHQTYPLYELIIQDDNSTDETMNIIKEYEQKYSFVKVYSNEGEHGVNGNFFSAFRRATGEYIAVCDQDDIWELNKIEQQVENIGKKLMCAHLTKPFSGDGSSVYFDARHPNVGLLRTIYRPEIAGHSMLFRRDLLEKIPFDKELLKTRMYDVVLSLVAGAFESIVYLPQSLVNHRRYSTAATFTSVKDIPRPTLGNGVYMLWWSLRNYRKIKQLSRPNYENIRQFLEALPTDSFSKKEGLRMLNLQLSDRWIDFLRFQRFCIRHRHEIFHTQKGGILQWLRAALYPILSSYNQRFLLKGKP